MSDDTAKDRAATDGTTTDHAAGNHAAIARAGLWSNNPVLVQLLGLSPLLAVTTSAVGGLGLGLATTLVITAACATVSLLRRPLASVIGMPAWLLIIAAFTTGVELLMKAYAYPLYQLLGIFVPLIVANGAILNRARAFASEQPPLPAAIDGLATGAGFTGVLLIVGSLREGIGNGTLFAGMELIFGPAARHWQLDILADGYRFPLLLLPPGAFLVAGLLIALKNRIDSHYRERHPSPPTEPGTKRVRTTGVIK
ncbi:MAG: electron transport complex subunit E [Porticoccaceae bacterium]